MAKDNETTKWAGKQMTGEAIGICLIVYGAHLMESGDMNSGAIAVGLGLVVSFIRHLL